MFAFEHDERQVLFTRPGHQRLVVGQVDQVLVALHAHGGPLVKGRVADQDDVLDQKGMRHANDVSDVGAQDGDAERSAQGRQAGLHLVEGHVEAGDFHEGAGV